MLHNRMVLRNQSQQRKQCIHTCLDLQGLTFQRIIIHKSLTRLFTPLIMPTLVGVPPIQGNRTVVHVHLSQQL